MFGLYSHFLKLWDHRNKHIRFEEVIRLENETLDEMLQRLTMECIAEQKRLNATESGTEQFKEMVEKYQRNTFDDDERYYMFEEQDFEEWDCGYVGVSFIKKIKR